jgi:transposase
VAQDLTDQEWERLRPLLPSTQGKQDGPYRDHRQVVNGILWRGRNSAVWAEIPQRYGPWQTCYDRFARWDIDGTWARIEKELQRRTDATGDLD